MIIEGVVEDLISSAIGAIMRRVYFWVGTIK